MTLTDLGTNDYEKQTPIASFWRLICKLWIKIEIFPTKCFALDDLEWPSGYHFLKADVKSFILTYNLFTFCGVTWLTQFANPRRRLIRGDAVPNFSKYVPLRSKKRWDLRNSLVLRGVTPLWHVAQWVSRAPRHHTLPAFLNPEGSKRMNIFMNSLYGMIFNNYSDSNSNLTIIN